MNSFIIAIFSLLLTLIIIVIVGVIFIGLTAILIKYISIYLEILWNKVEKKEKELIGGKEDES